MRRARPAPTVGELILRRLCTNRPYGPLAIAVAVALAFPAGAGSAEVGASAVKRPKSAKYAGVTGQGHEVTLYVLGRSVQYVSFRFTCDASASGGIGVQDIKLRRTPKGYRFGVWAHGSVSYSDDQSEENGVVSVSGRFSRTGRSVKGRARVKTTRCGDSGPITWRARR